MVRTVTVRKVKNDWKVYIYGTGHPDSETKSVSRTFKTKAEALKSAKYQRETAMKKWLRSKD